MKNKPLVIFSVLCMSYLIYTVGIWFADSRLDKSSAFDIAQGKLVWQKYNCQSCHQFYGLGGHLGPDLTNVYSRVNGNRIILSALIRSGNQRMPDYRMDTTEMESLLDFLEQMDASGNADPSHFKILPNGMIE